MRRKLWRKSRHLSTVHFYINKLIFIKRRLNFRSHPVFRSAGGLIRQGPTFTHDFAPLVKSFQLRYEGAFILNLFIIFQETPNAPLLNKTLLCSLFYFLFLGVPLYVSILNICRMASKMNDELYIYFIILSLDFYDETGGLFT